MSKKDSQQKNWQITPANSKRYSKYPDGNTPTTLASWSLPTTINVPAGSSIGVRQHAVDATGWTIAVTALATGLTYDSGTERIEAADVAAASGTATFTLSKTGETDVVATATVALTAGVQFPILDGIFIGGGFAGTGATAEQKDRWSHLRHAVFQCWPDRSTTVIQDIAAMFKTGNPDTKPLPYTNLTHLGGDGTARTQYVADNNYYARSTYPSGTIPKIASSSAVNYASLREVSGKKYYEWYWDHLIDTKGWKNVTDIAGIYMDNRSVTGLVSHDIDENGVSDSRFSSTFQDRNYAAELGSGDYYFSRVDEVGFPSSDWVHVWNGVTNLLTDYFQEGIDNRARFANLAASGGGRDYLLVEGAAGKYFWAYFGYYIYEGATHIWNSSTPKWPNGYDAPSEIATSAPPLGTLIRTSYRDWYKNTAFGGRNAGFVDMLKMLHESGVMSERPQNIIINMSGPSMANLGHAQYDIDGQLTRIWRAYVGSTSILTDFALALNAGTTFNDTVLPDECRVNWGAPVDACWLDRSTNYTTLLSREFQNVIWYMNPPGQSTATITLPSAGVGKAWYRLDASLYDSQNTTINNGALQVGTYSLKPLDGIMFVRGNA